MKVHAKCMHCGACLNADALDIDGSAECDDEMGVHDYDIFDPMGDAS